MKLAFFCVLATLYIASCVEGNAISGGRSMTRDYNINSGKLIDWYTCTAQGNYPDPTTCDHYIACTTALLAYQMPCAIADDKGNLLHYVRNSGPKEDESYCDWPQNVNCDISSPPNSTTQSPPTTTSKPVNPTTSAPPKSEDSCPSEGVVGGSCNPDVDCQTCGECDWYVFCNPGTSTWENKTCDFRTGSDGTIRVSEKLFFNQNEKQHGGICAPFASLNTTLQESYRSDPGCKPRCDFSADENCPRKYKYVDPKFEDDIWSKEPEEFSCEIGTKWEQASRSCVLCAQGEDCQSDC